MKHSLASLILAGAALLPGPLATPASAATMILHNFTGGASDGESPWGSLTLSDAKLYGMTYRGGSNGSGTLFSMTADGTGFALLHSFTGTSGDGAFPRATLTLSGSKIYGVVPQGGGSNAGALFSLNTDGTGFTPLHTFKFGVNDGALPFGSLTLSGSKLYGTTTRGGSNDYGTIFSINTDGTGFSLLHSFALGSSDGKYPASTLTLSGSKLYGTTRGGNADGTIFSMNTDGTGFTLLHNFVGGAVDGRFPTKSLTVLGSRLYGMTTQGGSSDSGTLFGINTDGTGFSLLHSFVGSTNDGSSPGGALTLVGSTLYGMSTFGGTSNSGTIFSISADGTGFGLLESFTGGSSNGLFPEEGDLTLSSDGLKLYGMTEKGGSANKGVVFSRAVPEPGAFALLGLGTLLLSAGCRNVRT